MEEQTHEIFCELPQSSLKVGTALSVKEAHGLIAELSSSFLSIHQMQLMIQSSFKTIKKKGIDFVIPFEDETANLLDADLDEESLDAVSNLKVLLKDVQNRIRSITSLGCSIEDLELGLVSWKSTYNKKPVSLKWQLGQTEISVLNLKRLKKEHLAPVETE